MIKMFRPTLGCRPVIASFRRTFNTSNLPTSQIILQKSRTISLRLSPNLTLVRFSSSAPPTQKENIYTIPNMLTLSRIAFTPIIGYFIVEHCYYEASIALFVASMTDVLDGWIARYYKQQTHLGSALDPMADKVLMTTLVISLSYADLIPGKLHLDPCLYQSTHDVIVALGGLILARDIGLILGTAWVRYKTLPPPVSPYPTLLKAKLDFLENS